MKLLLYSVLLSAALVINARAQVLRQIDPRQIAEVSGKIVDMPTLNSATVPQPTRRLGVSALSYQQFNTGGRVEARTVDNTELLQYSFVPTQTLPQANFVAKRAVLPDKLPEMGTVKTEKAPINPRTIRPLKPAGTEELKQQLLSPH